MNLLSEIHNLENEHEKQRINLKNGKILDNRVGGEMSITRSLGDFDLKKQGVISNP